MARKIPYVWEASMIESCHQSVAIIIIPSRVMDQGFSWSLSVGSNHFLLHFWILNHLDTLSHQYSLSICTITAILQRSKRLVDDAGRCHKPGFSTERAAVLCSELLHPRNGTAGACTHWFFIWLCYTLLIAYNMMSWLPTTLNDISRYLCGVLSHILVSKGSLKVTLISWCVWEFLPASAVFIHFPNRKAAQGGNGPILCYYF